MRLPRLFYRRMIVLAIFSVAFFCRSMTLVSAVDFSSEVLTTYEVDTRGGTQVKHEFTLTNLTPTLYVKQYAIQLQQTGISQIKAVANQQSLEPHITITDQTTNIALNFSDQIVGEGNYRQFQISYASPQIAVINGQVLEVRIPQTAQGETESAHQIILKTPLAFGQPYRVLPKPDKTVVRENQVIQTFSKVDRQGILAIFGREQIYQLDLRYRLANPHASPVMTQIALPPDTPYQQFIYQALEPKPTRVEEDADGNWLAEYQLAANQELTVNASALVKVTLDPNPNYPPIKPLLEHLAEQPYWETKSPRISQLADSISGPELLHQAVIEKLNYTQAELSQATERLGAEQSLEQPNDAVCQEFTDLFVALARQQGIPTRRLTGYAVTNDAKLRPTSLLGDVLHAWAEYYDQQTAQWHQVDPTWEDTTGGLDYFTQFDLNHIVFAINGVSSTLPYPAGSYKDESEAASQDIVVTLATDFAYLKPDITVEWQATKIGQWAIPGLYTLVLTNQTGRAWYDIRGKFISDDQIKLTPDNFIWRGLLPFQTKRIKFFVTHPGLLPARAQLHLQLKLTGEENSFEFEAPAVSTAPAIFTSAQQFGLFVALAGAGVIITLTAGSILVYRQKQASALRRQSKKLEKTARGVPTVSQTTEKIAETGQPSDGAQTRAAR